MPLNRDCALVNKKILVWDVDDSPPTDDCAVILWRNFYEDVDRGIISMPKLVEQQAENLRSRYLSWIYDLSQTRIGEKSVIEILKLRSGFSFWWMTSMPQKFNASDSSKIDDAIKLFALEDLLKKKEIAVLNLVSSNKELLETLKIFCKNKNIKFRFELTKSNHSRISFPFYIYRCLPRPIQAIIYLARYIGLSIPFLWAKKNPVFGGDICLFDVLIHLDKKTYSNHVFISNYWTSLVDKFREMKIETNWMHNYFRHEHTPSPNSAHALIKKINYNSTFGETHGLLEASADIKIFVNATCNYFKVICASFKLIGFRKYFQPASSTLNLWPLFKNEWNDSLRGKSAISQCLRIALYEKIVRALPRQRLGIYIQENQPWEMALIHAWRKAGHGTLVGWPHNTLRYWDLRYFQDPRYYADFSYSSFPRPDIVALQGPDAISKYTDGKYNLQEITSVEALRYLYLGVNQEISLNAIKNKSGKNDKKVELTVLICGDFISSVNIKMLTWLNFITKTLSFNVEYILKPHPACPINVAEYSDLNLQVRTDNLSELFPFCNVVFASNISSTTVDAYCSGIKVIRMIDGKSMNMSPLRAYDAGPVVSNPEELKKALDDIVKISPIRPAEYFYLDPFLPKWSHLINFHLN